MAKFVSIYEGRRRKRYLDWLMNKVDVPFLYSDMCNTLLCIEFEPIIGNDGDRAEDGMELRREFECFSDAKTSDISPCSMLEMLVAVSIRTAELMYEGDEGESPGHYFWVFLNTMGISKMKNLEDFRKKERQIVDICERFLDPNDDSVDIVRVKHPPKRWSKLEIWKKINWFLTENYYGR